MDKNENQVMTKNHYLVTLKKLLNLIKLHRKARKDNDIQRIKYFECKIQQLDFAPAVTELDVKNYENLIHYFNSQIKVINYIEKEGFISPNFENTGLNPIEIINICKLLVQKGILRKRNCAGLAYEFKN